MEKTVSVFECLSFLPACMLRSSLSISCNTILDPVIASESEEKFQLHHLHIIAGINHIKKNSLVSDELTTRWCHGKLIREIFAFSKDNLISLDMNCITIINKMGVKLSPCLTAVL